MADYIRREDATLAVRRYARNAIDKKVKELDVVDDVIDIVKELERVPAADVAEVVHGEWMRTDDDWNSLTTIQCSLCGEEWCFEVDEDVSLLNYKYCPNCGAKMDGGIDNVPD